MKKYLALLLALCMIFVLAACGGSTSAPAASAAPAEEAPAAEAPAEEAPAKPKRTRKAAAPKAEGEAEA